eukprot:s131_g16.t1
MSLRGLRSPRRKTLVFSPRSSWQLRKGCFGCALLKPQGGSGKIIDDVVDVMDVVEDQFAEELSLDWTRALTPRLHPEARAELQRKRGESMIQTEKGCKASKFTAMGKKLGEGEYAAVYKVEGKSQSYAMKVPHEGDEEAEEAAEHEIEVMSAAKEHHCHHVLPLIDKEPCIGGTKYINAFVTKLLPFDFEKWEKDYTVPKMCLLD